METEAITPESRPRLSVKETAAYLSVSTGTVYQLIYAGQIPHYRMGVGKSTIRFEKSDLDAYLAACKVPKSANAKPAMSPGRVNTKGFANLRRFGFKGLSQELVPQADPVSQQ